MQLNTCNLYGCTIHETNYLPVNVQRNYYARLRFRLLMLSIGAGILACLLSCNKLVKVDAPGTALTSDNIYTSDATAAAVLTGIYSSIANFSPVRAQTINCISLVCGLSADELTLYAGSSNANTTLVQYYQNRLNPGNSATAVAGLWNECYAKIYIVNLAVERLSASTRLTPAVKQQLLGEAKFLRAFFYFYLVNLYGDVPLTTSSDYRVNAGLTRSTAGKVYDQVIMDLIEARELLRDTYVAADAVSITTERVRPNKWTAAALLARVYLYLGEWSKAETTATAIINNTATYELTGHANTFLKNNKEAIWQIQPVNTGWNTEDGRVFILPSTGPTANSSVAGWPVYISQSLINQFEPGDLRRQNWVAAVAPVPGADSFYYPFKYKSSTLNAPVTEYQSVFRLAEQYLIRAEARTGMDDFPGAAADLNAIRNRSALPNIVATDKPSLETAIVKERRVELFSEWGHRWMDLKRTGKIDAVMTIEAPAKGTTWNSNFKFYPIPAYDILQNPNLVQNSGY